MTFLLNLAAINNLIILHFLRMSIVGLAAKLFYFVGVVAPVRSYIFDSFWLFS